MRERQSFSAGLLYLPAPEQKTGCSKLRGTTRQALEKLKGELEILRAMRPGLRLKAPGVQRLTP